MKYFKNVVNKVCECLYESYKKSLYENIKKIKKLYEKFKVVIKYLVKK